MRNKIHLAGLDTIDNAYGKSDSNLAFKLAKNILEKIEEELEKMRQTEK